jgi:hypothetical protein
MGEMKNKCKLFVGNLRLYWDNIKIDLTKTGWETGLGSSGSG